VRRDFSLPEDDENHLKAQGFEWDTILEGNVRWLIIRHYPIPVGYNVATADAALRIQPLYPDVQIDMVYFFPQLQSSRPIGALTMHPLEGKQYQQWSRHRTAANPWRPGIDNLGTHLLQVDSWLARELLKAAA
jgi:hypothetical protein